MKKIAVFMGGPSREHEVSMWSGRQVLSVLEDDAFPVVVSKEGAWAIDGGPPRSFTEALGALKHDCEIAFLALHGPFGEDGTLQGLLETAEIPYTGSGLPASALAMDKIRSKLVYQALGLSTAPFVPVWAGDVVRAEELCFASEWVVKPARDGSSFGVHMCETHDAVRHALAEMGGQDALVEARARGREFTCGVLDMDRGPTALPVTELIPGDGHPFFDFDAKYTSGATDEITPAEVSDEIRDQIQHLAVAAHRALGCRDMSRTDIMWNAQTRDLWILETNTIPGMTETSLLPQAAAAAGMTFEQLTRHVVARARGRIRRSLR
ncbi:MAG: D-alanine--D-alanine ligase [Myxococcota bacterium]